MINFIKKEIETRIGDYLIFVDSEKLSFELTDQKYNKNKKFDMVPVYSEKIKDAFEQGKIFLDHDPQLQFIKKPLYLSSRNILTRKINSIDFYMDLIVYNSSRNVLPGLTLNRSLGHENDLNELEVFQILDGEIISIFKNSDNVFYYGIFSKGDYFETPPGWFHCTYVFIGPAVIANFYCDAFWKNDISKKPYFKAKNEITVENNDGKVYIKTSKTKVNLANLLHYKVYQDDSLSLLPYEKIKEIVKLHEFDKTDIFELFKSDTLEKWVD
jgi:hypothetical protein